MKVAQQILNILIGEKAASTCLDEIDHRIYPEDSRDLKEHIHQVTVEKYIEAADLPIPDLFQKIRDHANFFGFGCQYKRD